MRFLIANLKMKLVSEEENAEYFVALAEAMRVMKKKDVQLVVCPSLPFLGIFKKKLPKGVALGAQNVFWEERGAFTGEVSPATLFDLGVSFSIIGHSERREFLGETDEMVAKKVRVCLQHHIRPILCVGESQEERETGKTFEIIKRQIRTGFQHVSSEQCGRILVAYEPRWAIGTNRTPSSNEIMEVAIAIKKILMENFPRDVVESLPLLYGGSVSAEQVIEVCLGPSLSGVLVGRESLVPSEVASILEKLAE